MKTYTYLIITLFLLGCTSKPEIALSYINGYWEIDHVVTADGTEKKYNFNATVDFFETKTDSTGYRTKLKPSFTKKYQGNLQKHVYKIKKLNNRFFIEYRTNFDSQITEQIIEASEAILCLKNEQGILYYYRPYKPISLE